MFSDRRPADEPVGGLERDRPDLRLADVLSDLTRDRRRRAAELDVDLQRRVDLGKLRRWELHVHHRPDHPNDASVREPVAVRLCHVRHSPDTADRASAPPTISTDLGGDLVLTGSVRLPGEHLDDLLRVVGRGLHRAPPRRVLRRRRLEQRGVHLRDEVLGQQMVEDLDRPRLEQVFRVRAAPPAPATSPGAIGRNRCDVARSVNADRKSVYAQCSSSIRPSAKSLDQPAADLLGRRRTSAPR